MRLLIISYDFPPVGGVSVQRVLSLVKYLPQHGFEVQVLAARNPASPVFDHDLVAQIPPFVTVHRVWTPEISYARKQRLWRLVSGGKSNPIIEGTPAAGLKSRIARAVKTFLSPDPHLVWVPFALRRARRIVRHDGIDVILVTAPPFSAFLIGNALKLEFPHLMLVSDFRDEWLRYLVKDFEFFQGGAAQRKAAVIERDTVAVSDLVLAVTNSSIQQLQQRYPAESVQKFGVVPNGYDPDVFGAFQPRRHEGDQVRVTYVGTVYGVCSPRYYLDALDQLPEEVREDFETVFVGRVVEEERRFLESRKSRIHLTGFLPQREAFRQMEESDYFLLTVVNDFCIAGKLFEYLRAGKPIIAITPPEGEIGRIIRETRGGWCVDPRDQIGIVELLHRLHADSKSGKSRFAPDVERIRTYERPHLAADIAELIKSRRTGIPAQSTQERAGLSVRGT